MDSTVLKHASVKWTDDQLKLAFYLYCQLPFGKLHSRNPSVINLANLLGRSPGSVAMKLVNFASLDPAITNSGRKGLGNASAADKRIWDEFNANWNSLVDECEDILHNKKGTISIVPDDESCDIQENYAGETRNAIVKTRIRQGFFRKTVLAAYQSCCCMSKVSHSRLLVASHIIPWAKNEKDRLNPRNGLCLSAIHDRAFDCGLLSVKPDLTILVSNELKLSENEGEQTRQLIRLEGRKITLPQKFQPEVDFLDWHNKNVFRR